MKRNTKRTLAGLLALVMVLSLLPMSALAARTHDEPLAAVPAGEEATRVGAETPSASAPKAQLTEDTAARHYFAKAAAGANPWTIVSGGKGVVNTLSYEVSSGSYTDVTTLDATKPHRMFADSTGAPGNGFLRVALSGDVLVATCGAGHPGNAMVTFEAQSNGAYILSCENGGTRYYLTAETKTYNGKASAVFKADKAAAVPYFVEMDNDKFRFYCEGPYAVSFTGEGVSTEPVSAMYGQKVALPEAPTRDGYTFQGWFNGETQVTEPVEVTGDTTLTARWTRNGDRTPADALAEGNRVHYLSWTADNNGGWCIDNGAYALKLYLNAEGDAVTGIADGSNYAIYAVEGARYMYAPFQSTSATAQSSLSGNYTKFTFVKAADTPNTYTIRSVQDPSLYLTNEATQYTVGGKTYTQLKLAAQGTQFYVTPAADSNDGTYHIWYETEGTRQTYANPAAAEADGKVVKYFGFNYDSRYWTAVDTASAAHCVIHLYRAENDSTETTAGLVADTDGVDDNARYVLITDPSEDTGMGVLHYASNGDTTNQCRSADCRATVLHAEHLFVLEAVDGGYSIRPNGVEGKYLSLEASGNQRKFKTERTVFYITPAAEAGTYYIWTANDAAPGSKLSAMLDTAGTANTNNTWAFVGGRAVQGTFEELGLARDMAGQLEEYLRWEKRGNNSSDEGGTPQSMQRYVINTAYDGQSLSAVVSDAGWARVTAVDPRAAVYMTAAEDAGSATFAADLKSFIDKALALRSGNGFAVVIKGNGQTALNAAVDTVVDGYESLDKARIAVVDGALTDAQLTGGYPNAKGHLELAKRVAEAVTGGSANFPTSLNDAAAIADGRWANKLTDQGVTIFGSAPATLSAAQQAVKTMVDGTDPMTWLFMGDSITHGALWAEGEGTISQDFEKFVKNDLDRASDIVVNTGVSGATSATTVREIQVRLNKYDPDVVSIMIGTNDAAGKRVTVANYKTNLQTIVNAILAKGAIAVLRTPIPDGASGRGENIYEYAAAVREVYNGLTDDQKAKVIVVDQFEQWAPYLMTADKSNATTFLFGKVFTQDGNKIHPGPVGHLWMTQELIDGLGLWGSSASVCKLSYAQDWGITETTGAEGLADAYFYDVDTRKLSVPMSALGLSGTVISAELAVTIGEETLTAAYLRDRDGALSVTVPEGAEAASLSVTALVSESANAGKKVTFASAEVDLTAGVAYPKMPAPEVPVVYEYRLDTDGAEDGEYGITAPGNNRTVGMHDSGSYTNQCPVEISGEVMVLPHAEHNWKIVRLTNGKYTVQGSGGKYLTSVDCTNPSNQLVLSETAEEFTITHVSNGSYTVQNAAGKYLQFTETGSKRWGMTTDAAQVRLYKKTRVDTVAPTEFKGTADRPMDPDRPGSYFRIPSLVTLNNGWIMATSDIRWYTTNDSPNNLDTIVSISKDNGVTWEYEVVNYLSDYAALKIGGSKATYGEAKDGSASFIDPSVVQDSRGTIWLLVDLQPPYVNGGKIGNGFDSQGRLLVGNIPAADYTMENAHDNNLHGYTYDYYVDINNAAAGAEKTVNMTALKGAADKTVKLWPICAKEGDIPTGYYADAFFNTYYDHGEDGFKPVLAIQTDSSALIHNNLFYVQSEWKAFPTAFIMVRSAEIQGDGLVWSDPKLLNSEIKRNTEHFIGVCPGRGVTTTVNGKERIVFPLYDNQTGNELASVIYTDDYGATWHRGAHTPELNGTGKTSESQIVVLPDNNNGTFLRMFSRNGKPTISYADSTDGGQTWGTSQMDTSLNANNNNNQGCMESFINVAGVLRGPDGTVYNDLVMTSYPMGTTVSGAAKRTNGTIRIGSYNKETGGAINWLNVETSRFPSSFIYSCLTQKMNDEREYTSDFALLYETDDGRNAANVKFTDLRFYNFTMADLLGENWAWALTEADLPEIDPPEQQVYTPAQAAADGKTVTYLSFFGGDAGTRYWSTSATAADTAKLQLYAASGAESSSTTTLDVDGIQAGGYVINFDTGNASRQAVMHYSDGVTNQCSSVSVTCGSNGPLHLFTFAAAGSEWDNAFTIEAYNAGKFLSLEASDNQRAFKDEATTFYVTPVAGTPGSYYLWTAEDAEPEVPGEDYSTWEKAETAFSGTTDGEPFSTEDIGTRMFRIPAIITLDNGWLVAAADVRWMGHNDNPANLDTVVSVSKDGGATWEWEIVNYFGDYDNGVQGLPSGSDPGSAAFTDPVLIQDPANRKVWLGIDVTAANGKATAGSTGFDSQGRLLVAHAADYVGAKAPESASLYTYYVSKTGASFTVDGAAVTLYPIESSNGATDSSGVYVDAFMNLYTVTGSTAAKVWCKQEGAEKAVQNNLFYKQSPWKVFPTCFLMVRSADVTADGLVWNDPMLLDVRYSGQTQPFFGVCPGRGYITDTGRIIFTVYDNATGEKTSTIYSDDHGVTWQRGERSVIGEGGKTSESQIIRLPDGTLRMYSRNSAELITYADSTDNGLTWSSTQNDPALVYGGNCMISVINVAGTLVGPDGRQYQNVVMASYPKGTGSYPGGQWDAGRRAEGTLRIGYISGSAGSWTTNWFDQSLVYKPGRFCYSCLTQFGAKDAPENKFAALYEPNDNVNYSGGVDIEYFEFDVADVLGEGWTLLPVSAPVDPNACVVTFTGEGMETFTVTVRPGETLDIPADPTRPGYLFEGWYVGTTPFNFGITVTGNLTLTARWSETEPVVPGNLDDAAVTVSPTSVAPGGALAVTVAGVPADVADLALTMNGAAVELTRNADGTYTGSVNAPETAGQRTLLFILSATNCDPKRVDVAVTVTGGGAAGTGTGTGTTTPVTPPAEEDLNDPDVPLADLPKLFDDVKGGDWFYEAAKFVSSTGLMLGVSETHFEPTMNTTRGMIVTILYRMEKEPEVDPTSFLDVPQKAWYSEGAAWGEQTGIAKGMSDGNFYAMEDVTREQLAAFLFRFAEHKGYDVTTRGDLAAFGDSAAVSDWAADAMSWAVGMGLIKGKGEGGLDPKSTATRSEVATILMRFVQTMEQKTEG